MCADGWWGWFVRQCCASGLAPRPRRRTWVKEWIIDSDKALWALIAAGELDYLFKLPSLAKGESYQRSPDWPHIVLLWTCSGRGQETDVCLHVRIYLGRIEIAQSLPVTVCLLSHDPPDVSPVELSRVVLFLEITYSINWGGGVAQAHLWVVTGNCNAGCKSLTFSLDKNPGENLELGSRGQIWIRNTYSVRGSIQDSFTAGDAARR